MLNSQKPLWIKTVKLLSTDIAADFIDDLECEGCYTKEITAPIRQILSQNIHSGDYDLWNAGLENNIPSKLLDIIEEENDEETACDLEDYFLYMEKRLLLYPVFDFWYSVFSEAKQNETPIELETDNETNEEICKLVDSYITYTEEFYDSLRKTEPGSEWDKTLNQLGAIYMEDCDEAVTIDNIRAIVAEFAFCNISYEFWTRMTELLGDDTEQLKSWCIYVYGAETMPYIPVVSDDAYEEEEEEE